MTRASETEFVQLRADALLALGEVLAATGVPHEGLEPLKEAIALYDRKGFVALADRAKARLSKLNERPN